MRADPDICNDAREFARIARVRLLSEPQADTPSEAGFSDFDLNPDFDTALLEPVLRPAAVLVGIVAHDPATMLLTERTAHLTEHAGQIAFPGGRIEPTDASPRAAALREAKEEIGLDAAQVETLGYLPAYRTSTGFRVTPVVALIQPPFTLEPDPREVARVFEVPLAFLMSEANHRIDSRPWRGANRRFYAMPYEQHYIWGVTAGIIKSLHRSFFTQ